MKRVFGGRSAGTMRQVRARRDVKPAAQPCEPLEKRVMMAADVIVNEIMYQSLSKSEGDEWIELYNRGNDAADLNGWKISKGVDYTFGNVSVPAGGYLVVAADVTKFQAKYPGVAVVGGWTGRLSNSQETVSIEDVGGATVDNVTYADQGDWGARRRGPNDLGHQGWVWVQEASGLGKTIELQNPNLSNNNGQNWLTSTVMEGTPGAQNSVYSTNIGPIISDLKQSLLIPKSTETVAITAKITDEAGAPSSASLHWRVDAQSWNVAPMADDGSGGDAIAGDGIYTGEIPPHADKTIIEFFVSASDGANTRTLPGPTDNLGAQQANALLQFDNTVYTGVQPIYRLIMTAAERAEIADIGAGGGDQESNAQMNATFIAIDGTGSQVRYNVGVRNRGHGSRTGTPNNYRVNIPTDNVWKDKKAVNFNARTVHNQVIGSAIWRLAGFPAPDAAAVQLRLNGVLSSANAVNYALVEETDSAWAENHFPNDSNGNAYGAFRLDPGLVPEAELQWLGTDPNQYRGLYPKNTNEEMDDYSDLIQLVNVLNNTPTALLVQEAKKVLNLDSWIKYIALDNLMLNRETGIVRGVGDDYNMYRGEVDKRFILVPHDLDTILASGSGSINQSIWAFIEGVAGESGGSTQNGLAGLVRLFQQPEVIQSYYKAYIDWIANYFNPTKLNPLVDQVLSPFASPTQIQDIKNFIVNRSNAVLAQIPRNFIVSSPLSQSGGYYRTDQPATSISGSANASITRSVLVNGQPAIYNPRSGVWSLNTGTSTGGTGTSVTSFIGASAVWKYLDGGADPGASWYTSGFGDGSWATGRAQLGYSENQENDETTLINGGPVGGHYPTYYFRRSFNISNKASFTSFSLQLMVDDGAAIYINGNPVPAITQNLPANFTATSTALLSISGAAESAFTTYQVDASYFVEGQNTIAVEVHQQASDSSDVSFDLRLDGTTAAPQPPVLIQSGSSSIWNYLADGSNQGTAWTVLSFNDATWATGRAELGFGDGNETTNIGQNPFRFTTYFRKKFTIADKNAITALAARVMRDDGAVVWLNGNRVINANMGTGAVNFNTPALTNVAGGAESTFFDFSIDPALLNNGDNILAVEVHNIASNNVDLSFDFQLNATYAGGPVTVSGGVPLHPGINRVAVQAFDGPNGTGNQVNSSFIDVWYDGTNNGTFTPKVDVDSLQLVVPEAYVPGLPILVQVKAINDGAIQKGLWNGTVTLTSGRPDVALSESTLTLKNGVGSLLITPSGAGTASGAFELRASLGSQTAQKNVMSLAGTAMQTVSGTLAGGSTSWSGVVHVTGDLTVPAGHTLTIQPGTIVLLNGIASGTTGTDIIVNGNIQSLGTAAQPVFITAFNPAQAWGEINHINAGASLYQYTFITRGGNSPGVGHTGTGPTIRSNNSALSFINSSVSDTVGKMGYMTNSALTFTDSFIGRAIMGPEIEGTSLLMTRTWITDMRGSNDNDGIYLHDQQAGQTISLIDGVIAGFDDDGIDTLGSDVLIDGYIVRDGKDKAISVFGGTTTIKNSLVVDNSLAPEDGTAASISAKGSGSQIVTVNIDNTTIVGNTIGIQARNKDAQPNVTIIYNVTDSIIRTPDPVSVDAPYDPTDIHISYSNVQEAWAGTGNINADPLFVDPANYIFGLKPGSPSINAADPAAANNDPDGTRGDMGLYRNGVSGTFAPKTLSGTLSGATILSPEGGAYSITGNVIIPAGSTLYILPGTSLHFAANTGIFINGGRIVAEGTEYEQIRFTRTPGSSVFWDGVQISSSNLDNRISWAVMEYGQTADHSGMLGVSSSRVTIDHVYFDKTIRRRLRFNNASIILRNSEFADIFPGAAAPGVADDNVAEHIWGSGILAGGQMLFENNIFGTAKGHNDVLDIDTANRPGPIFIIRNNIFKGGGDDALDMEGDALIEGNLFQNFIKDQYNTGTGNANILSAGSDQNYTMVRNTIVNSEHVAQVKELSFLTFINNTVVGGPTATAAIYFFRPGQANSWGEGAYIDGNIFKDKPVILADFTNTTQITINRSIVPAAYLGYGTGNSSEDPRFVDQANGDYALRRGSPARGTGPNGINMGAAVPQWVSISGEPASTTGRTGSTLTINGPSITHYRYRLDGGAWSAEAPIATPITLAGLSAGPHTVYVIGRNDAGEWQDINAPTASRTWTVETSPPSIRVNEVLAAPLAGGADLIELYNDGNVAVNLNGMSISDNPASPRKYVFGSVTINPGQYLQLYANSSATPPGIHTGFSLSREGEGVYFYDTLAAGGGLIDGVAFGYQIDGYSIGRAADGTWKLNTPTFGAANLVQRTGDPSRLKINEWLTDGVAPFADDFIELYNPDALPIALGGLYLSDNPNPSPDKFQIDALSFVGAGNAYGVFIADDDEGNGANHTNYNLASEQGLIGLFDADGTQIDKLLYTYQSTGISQGRSPDGGPVFQFFTQPNPGLSNTSAVISTVGLRITELNYNPVGGNLYEFIEFQNVDAVPIDLTGVRLEGASNFTFGNLTLNPGEKVVIVGNQAAFEQRYGNGVNIAGAYSDPLNDNGGVLRLLDSLGGTILDFGYSDQWYATTDGGGATLVIVNPNAAANTWGQAVSWRASNAPLGTPGISEEAILPANAVVINEIMTHTAGINADWIELRNTTGAAIDLGGWYLSGDANNLLGWQLPGGTTLDANGYLLIDLATQFGGAFALNGDGGNVYLSSSITTGSLTGYRAGVNHGATDAGVSLGRHTTSTGAVDFVQQSAPTPGTANAYPRVGPVVISEIQYNPSGSASEFIELHNSGDQLVRLYDPANPSRTWKFIEGIDFVFPQNAAIPAGGYLLVVPIDPATYRALHDIPASVQIFGPYSGALNNGGERLTLVRPGVNENALPEVPYVTADFVDYGSTAPWVLSPNGQGPSLARKAQGLYGNDPANWIADATPTLGTPGTGSPGTAPTAAGGFSASGGVHKLVFTFSRDISATLSAADLLLENLTTGTPVAAGAMSVAWDPLSFTATWTFPGLAGGKLPEARYRATLLAAGLSAAGQQLDGDGNGVSGDNHVTTFIQLAGDANGDGKVDNADFVILYAHMDQNNATWDWGDFNGDGIVDFGDYQQLGLNFGKTLPPNAASPVPAPAKPVVSKTVAIKPAMVKTTRPDAKAVQNKQALPVPVQAPKPLFAAKRIGKRSDLLA